MDKQAMKAFDQYFGPAGPVVFGGAGALVLAPLTVLTYPPLELTLTATG